MGLAVGAAERLVLNEGELLSGFGRLVNNGEISGRGAIGLIWREPIGGDAPERVVCRIIEADVPVLELETEIDGMKISVSCADVGAASYWLVFSGEESAMSMNGDQVSGSVWAEEDGDFLVAVRAVNSRGNTVSASAAAAVYAGAARYRIVKDLFPLRLFRPEEELVFMARITDRRTGRCVKRAEAAEISYSCYEVVKNLNGVGRKIIPSRENISVGVNCIADSASVLDGWLRDVIGGNFRFAPGMNLKNWFGKEKGVFDAVFSILMKNGVRIEFEWSVIAENGEDGID